MTAQSTRPARTIKVPGPEHPITIEPCNSRVTVQVGDRVVASSRRTLRLREAAYPAVLYVPRADADMTRLTRSKNQTYCPYKGDCHYFDLQVGDRIVADAVWTYEQPFAAVAEIKDHLAFYTDRVDSICEQPAD